MKLVRELFSIFFRKLKSFFSSFKNLLNPGIIYTKIRMFIKKFFDKFFSIKPKDSNDYYKLGRYLISRRLVTKIIFIIGILGLYYFLVINSPGIFSNYSNGIKTYSYKSVFLRFVSDKVRIKSESGYTAYVGAVDGGMANGKGTLYKKTGDICYKGDFKDNEYNGKGTLFMDEGVYVGDFQNNQFEGEGELYRTDGSMEYKGEFKDGKKSGEGELYDSGNNVVFQGNFNEDILMYSDFLGKSTDEVAQMYKGKRTIYYDSENFVVDMEDINAVYAGSSDENYLDESVQIRQIFIKSERCMFDGQIMDSINKIKEIAGEPSFEGFSYITMPEAVALGNDLQTEGSLEDAKEVKDFDRNVELYLTMFEHNEVQYTFYSYESGDKFIMYEIEK